MKIVVGLGNPGAKYQGTRHNVGFDVVDYLAAGKGVGRPQTRFQSEVAEWLEAGEKVLLVKPQTFMNLSGRAVRQLLDFYQLPPAELLVVCDDVNLPLGRLRVRARGTHGGHNGLRDIQAHLGTTEYARLRIGVGAADEGADLADHVLSRFRPTERAAVEDAVARAAQAVVCWVAHGVEATMNRFNAPEKKEKPQD
jgi:PTH1 family peptidyl-tRNA hydrolase